MKLVWSQPAPRSHDRARSLLLVSVLCLFLGGVVVGAGGHDLRETPRPVRAAIASLLTTGGVLFLFGVVSPPSGSRGGRRDAPGCPSRILRMRLP